SVTFGWRGVAIRRSIRIVPERRSRFVETAASVPGRYCCKSRKSNNPKNLAKVDFWTSLLPCRFSAPLRRSLIDFGSTDMVSHVVARKAHQRLLEFSFVTPKRLLQQYLHFSDLSGPAGDVC